MLTQATRMDFKGKRLSAIFETNEHGIVKLTIRQNRKPGYLHNDDVLDAVIGDERELAAALINEYREDLTEFKSMLEMRYSSPARDLLDAADKIRHQPDDEGEEVGF